jgi:para-nitrobenzyl esterase
VIDRKVVPEEVKSAFEAGRMARVPYLIGSNSYEAGFFPDWADGLSDTLAGQWSRIESVYDGYGTRQKPAIEGQLATDIMSTAATREMARAAARHGMRTYVYHFSYLRPSQRGKVHGAMHVDEVYAVFDMMHLVEPQASLPEVRRVVADVQSRWVQFAKTGRPTDDNDEWPTFRQDEERVLEFANDGPVVRLNFARERLDLADALTSAAVSRMAAK